LAGLFFWGFLPENYRIYDRWVRKSIFQTKTPLFFKKNPRAEKTLQNPFLATNSNHFALKTRKGVPG
jgi:hypothetical protein